MLLWNVMFFVVFFLQYEEIRDKKRNYYIHRFKDVSKNWYLVTK